MGLSESFYDYLSEIQQIDKWEKLPKDDVRIIKLQLLANETTKFSSETGRLGHVRKRVAAYKDGRFIQAFENSLEASECFGVSVAEIQKAARGQRRGIGEFELRYIERIKDE